MNREGKTRLVFAAASGLCGLGLLCSAAAAPPLNGGKASHPSAPPLDLRLSGDREAPLAAFFPSAMHHGDFGKADLDADGRVARSVLGSGEMRFRVMSQAEIFARRVHREGLPIARLWESKSALLSLGLNPRGKPGLWLTQKTR